MIKLGIIGMSKRNGHPYSWAAIFNGYNKKFMQKCPFPVIPQYLFEQTFPKDSIKNAKVTHIWTQDKKLSEHIAKASNIENVVNKSSDLIGKVDAILLARDDYQNHYKMSKPFIEAGLPIYIDKPLSITIKEAKKILSLEKYKNQIFTCSALSFAKELQLTEKDKNKIGQISHIDAIIIKDWNKYGIHIIEPVMKILSNNYKNLENIKINKTKTETTSDKKTVIFKFPKNISTTISTLGNTKSPITIRIFGEKGFKELKFKDTFLAFKNSLQKFINIVEKKDTNIPQEFTLKVIAAIEKGNK